MRRQHPTAAPRHKLSKPSSPPDRPPHLIFVMPRFVATTRMGAMSDSRARFRKEKHSMSSMCTCGARGASVATQV